MKVLMTGVSEDTKGGMYTVVENYLNSAEFNKAVELKYIPMSTVGSIPRRLFFSLKGILKIIKELLFHHYEIMHVHMSEKGSVYRKNLVILISKLLKVKVVIHMHGAEFEVWFNNLSAKRKKRVIEIINRGDRIIILGDYWKSFFEKIVNDKNKIIKLYNSVPTYNHNPYNNDARSFLFLGSLIKRKGIYDLLDAIRDISVYLPHDITFDLYGPNIPKEVNEKIIQYELQERVFYHGWLKKEQKEKVFGNTMVNILPSYNEGLPMSILETMAYGIPNISTKVAAIPEAIENGIKGVLVDKGDIKGLSDAILHFINNSQDLNKLSDNCFSTVNKNFSISAHIEKLILIYRDLK